MIEPKKRIRNLETNSAKILPDLILLDIRMPVMDGYKVCRGEAVAEGTDQ